MNSAAPNGFFMAETVSQARNAVEIYRGLDRMFQKVMRVKINTEVADKIIGVLYSIDVYYNIKVNNFPRANKEIKRGFIRFEEG